jgi:hypothetical protein
MVWEIEYTDEFKDWWDSMDEFTQDEIAMAVNNLHRLGPSLPHPYSSGINSSRHRHMRELRIQHRGKPYRVLYAFDPRRTAILLLGGMKDEGRRFYRKMVPRADRIYDQHLAEIENEDSDHG